MVRSDATALPFRTGSFDVVMAAGVLGLLDLHSRQAALREMARVTRGEIRLLEPFRRPGAPPRTLRAHVIGLVPDRPLDLTELAEVGLIPEVHGPPLLERHHQLAGYLLVRMVGRQQPQHVYLALAQRLDQAGGDGRALGRVRLCRRGALGEGAR